MASGILSLEEFPAYLNSQKNLSRYDPRLERKPNHLWYNLDKARIDGLLKAFAQAVVDILKESPDDDKELQLLIRSANQLSNVERSAAIKVALLGAQGAGKSLSTNAVFDCDGLSLTGADGAACTSSITRYTDYPTGGNGVHRFFAEIKFLNAEKREALIQEHARSYYQYQHAEEDSDDEDAPPAKKRKRENNDAMDLRLKDTAEDVFVTLFGSREAFQECWSATAYRNQEFVRICKLKCEETLQNEGPDRQGVVLKSAHDQGALLDQLKPFLTKVLGVNCLWPLVDNVTVSFSSDILAAGLEIIDLPGWGDLNLSRARHVEEINDTVDVVIILADTVRITSDEKLVSSIRAAIAHHGAAKVKIVATKIDDINKNQLSQYKGGIYDEIKQCERYANEQEALLDDDDDLESLKQKGVIAKYKSYLARSILQAKVSSRSEIITNELTAKLRGRSTKELPQVFHTSASEYMEWIKPDRINFKDQPSLSVQMTGIPAIRQFLFSLPADQNLKDYEDHIYTTLPTFMDKIQRTITESDRDGGFFTISDDFDGVRKPYMTKTLSDAKAKFQDASNKSIAKVVLDLSGYKEQIQDLLQEDWFDLKAAAFNRILKNRGKVPKGLSKARGLENGADWNRDLATLLGPAFHKWSKAYKENTRHMWPSLAYTFTAFHHKVVRVMNNSAANVPTVEKAKMKWDPLGRRIQAKIEGLMEEVERVQSRLLEWATMEFDRQTNLMSEVTDSIYVEVYNTAPALKPVNPNAKRQYKQYVEPKLKFQKKKLGEMFLQSDNHFVEQVINHFQSVFDKNMRQTLDKHFGGIEKVLDDFNAAIRAQGPIIYQMTTEGEAIRTEVQQRIPELQERIDQLGTLLPARASLEENGQGIPLDNVDVKEEEDDLAFIYEKMAKRKKAELPTGHRHSKRVKQESL